jgi:hypothetical protein
VVLAWISGGRVAAAPVARLPRTKLRRFGFDVLLIGMSLLAERFYSTTSGFRMRLALSRIFAQGTFLFNTLRIG